MTSTEKAAILVREWGDDFTAAHNLSDQAIGELIRRIATALAQATASNERPDDEINPSGHTAYCDYHCEQRPEDCSCGLAQYAATQTAAP